MDEAEWLASDNPQAMLRAVQGQSDRGSSRKFRLFAVACCRAIWPHFPSPVPDAWRKAADAAEKYADGQLSDAGFHQARDAHARWIDNDRLRRSDVHDLSMALLRTVDSLLHALPSWLDVTSKHRAAQAALLREIVGNPWRPVTLCGKVCMRGKPKRECLYCNRLLTPTVLSLARACYEERQGRKCERCGGGGGGGGGGWARPDGSSEAYPGDDTQYRCPDCHGTGRIETGHLDPLRLAVLSDALEEAGCDSGDILNHLRSKCPACTDRTGFVWGKVAGCRTCNGTGEAKGPHVRGYWALDLILGKE